MEVKIVLDEEESFMAEYYADMLGVSVEEAFKMAFMDKLREMYEARSMDSGKAGKNDSDEMPDDDF